MNHRMIYLVAFVVFVCAAVPVIYFRTSLLQPVDIQIRSSNNSVVAGGDIENSRIIINGLTEDECERLIEFGRRRSEFDIVAQNNINKRISELAEQLGLEPAAFKEIVRIAGNRDDSDKSPRKAILDAALQFTHTGIALDAAMSAIPPDSMPYMEAAIAAYNRGNLEECDEQLKLAEENSHSNRREIGPAQPIEETAAKIAVARGEIELVRARYEEASQHFEAARRLSERDPIEQAQYALREGTSLYLWATSQKGDDRVSLPLFRESISTYQTALDTLAQALVEVDDWAIIEFRIGVSLLELVENGNLGIEVSDAKTVFNDRETALNGAQSALQSALDQKARPLSLAA